MTCTFLVGIKVFEALRPRDHVDVLHEDVPGLGAEPRHGDLEPDPADEARPDVEGGVEEPEGVPAEGHILELDLPLQQRDGELVGVEVLEVLAEVVVEEPGGQALQHDEDVSRRLLT